MPGLENIEQNEAQTAANTTSIQELQNNISRIDVLETNTGVDGTYAGVPLLNRITTAEGEIGDIEVNTGVDHTYGGLPLETRITHNSDRVEDLEIHTGVDGTYSGVSLQNRLTTVEGEIGDLEYKTGANANYTGATLTNRILTLEQSVSEVGAPIADKYVDQSTAAVDVFRYKRTVVKVNNSKNDQITLNIYAGTVTYDQSLPDPPTDSQPVEWQNGDTLEIICLRRKNDSNNNHRVNIDFINIQQSLGGGAIHYDFHSLPVFYNGSTGGDRELNNVGSNGHFQICVDTATANYRPQFICTNSQTYYRFRVWRFRMPDDMISSSISAYSNDPVLSNADYYRTNGVAKDCIIFMLEQQQ